MKKLLTLILALGVFSACQEDFNEETATPSSSSTIASTARLYENDKPDEHMAIVLGKKMINPYTVQNMQAAFNYYNSVVPNSPFTGKTVQATHLYIKIMPNAMAQLEMLDKLDQSDDERSPVLQDYPMDYEVLEEGDYYAYPANENDLFHPAYTVIPVGYAFPSTVPYIVLDQIYEPAEEEFDVETVALYFAGCTEDLEADEISVTDETLPDYLIKELADRQSLRISLWPKRYRPSGWVKVQNTETNIMDPLMQVKISIGRNVFWRYTYTDNNGYFSAPKKYRGKVRIRAKWRGYTATIRKTWNEILGLWVSDHLMTITRGNNNITKNIMHGEPHTGIFGIDLQGGHLWFKGTVHNGLRKYIDFCNSNGISHTVSNANVWAFAKGKDASTPMLYKYPQLASMSTLANVGQANFWSVLTNVISGVAINLVPAHLRPDQIFGGLNNKKVSYDTRANTIRIHQVVFHESGHYSHASKAGSSYWANVFASEISNHISYSDSYYNGSAPSFTAAKRIAVAEGWGNFTEFKITTFYYGKSYISPQTNITQMYSTAGTNNFMEQFNVYDTPMSVTRTDDHSWFLHGIMWDLVDNAVDNAVMRHRDGNGNPLNAINDQVFLSTSNPNSLAPIFNALNSGVTSAATLKTTLQSSWPAQSANINNLFSSYGY
jgi:hypothetical protein